MGQKQSQNQLQEQRELWTKNMTLPLQVSGVLFALDLVFLQNLVQSSDLSGWRVASLCLFTIALPCLAVNVLGIMRMLTLKVVLPGKAVLLLLVQLAGYLASFFGVWASVMAVSWWIGCVFLIVTFIMTLFYSNIHQRLNKIHSKEK